jgi:hypothetical protein
MINPSQMLLKTHQDASLLMLFSDYFHYTHYYSIGSEIHNVHSYDTRST